MPMTPPITPLHRQEALFLVHPVPYAHLQSIGKSCQLCFELSLISLSSFLSPRHTHHLRSPQQPPHRFPLFHSWLCNLFFTQQPARFKLKYQITVVWLTALRWFPGVLRIKSKAVKNPLPSMPWLVCISLARSFGCFESSCSSDGLKLSRGLGGFMLTFLEILLYQTVAWFTLQHQTFSRGGSNVNLVVRSF